MALPPANCFLRHGFPLCTRPPLRAAWSGSALYHGACIHPFRPIAPLRSAWARRSRTAQGALVQKCDFGRRVFTLLYIFAKAFILRAQIDFFAILWGRKNTFVIRKSSCKSALRSRNFWTAPLAAVCPKIVALALFGRVSIVYIRKN